MSNVIDDLHRLSNDLSAFPQAETVMSIMSDVKGLQDQITELIVENEKLQSELAESLNQVANLINAEAACKRDYASETEKLDKIRELKMFNPSEYFERVQAIASKDATS